MQTLNLVTGYVKDSLQDFIQLKDQYKLSGEIPNTQEGLNLFELHVCSEILTSRAFVNSRNLEEEFLEWCEISEDDPELDLTELYHYKQLKSGLLNLDTDPEEVDLTAFEIMLYTRVLAYRQYLVDTCVQGDFDEFLNELTIDLSVYGGPDMGLIEYLIEEQIICDDEE